MTRMSDIRERVLNHRDCKVFLSPDDQKGTRDWGLATRDSATNPKPLAPNPSRAKPVIHEESIKACPARSYGCAATRGRRGGAATRGRRVAGATKTPADGSQPTALGFGILAVSRKPLAASPHHRRPPRP